MLTVLISCEVCEVSVLWVCSEGVGTHGQADSMAYYQPINKKSRLFLPPVFYLPVGIITPSALWLTLQKANLSLFPPLHSYALTIKIAYHIPRKAGCVPLCVRYAEVNLTSQMASVTLKLWCVSTLYTTFRKRNTMNLWQGLLPRTPNPKWEADKERKCTQRTRVSILS